MCGRLILSTPAEQLAAAFDLPEVPALAARYNVAPSQSVAVVGLKPDGATRGLALLRWGLVPHWAADPAKGPRPINLRAETAAWKFGNLLRRHRCLVPANGFYEWRVVDGKKVPRRFVLTSGGVFALAGVWDAWGRGPDRLLTCAVLTTAANDLVGEVHDRMPAIVPPEGYPEWLDPGTPEARLLELLRPYPAELMAAADASPRVNSPKSEGPDLLDPAA